jgi:hypothetical protein
MMDLTYKKAVENADALKALGQTRVYLYGNDKERPWKYVTNAQPGGSHRLDIHTNVLFTAEHPCGIQFEWNFDIEPHSANGNPQYAIDIKGCQEVLAKIPQGPREQFAKQLRDSAAAVRENAKQYKTAWENAEQLADQLESV